MKTKSLKLKPNNLLDKLFKTFIAKNRLLIGSTIVFLFIVISQGVKAQNWEMQLNNITPPFDPNFGTITNDPINFYTNNTKWMVLGTTGVLNLSNLTGTGSRFLQTDPSGNIFPWTGTNLNSNKILFGDGIWRPNLITVDGNAMYIDLGAKFGIGVSAPSVELDVAGDTKISNNLSVGNDIQLGATADRASIIYTPSNGTNPSILNFRMVGGGGGNNNNNNTHSNQDDPLPDMSCINGSISSVYLFRNMITVQTPYNSNVVGNLNFGHNGYRAFVESQGLSSTIPGVGNLHINAQCNKNIYLFNENGTPFSPTLTKIMSVNGRVNVTDLMQIGHYSFTNFMETGSKLYVYSSGVQDGVKTRHGGAGGAAFRAIELSDNDYGLAVFRGNQTSDGAEKFSVRGDGLTIITPTNPDALSVIDGTNLSFKVAKTGRTIIGYNLNGFNTAQLAISSAPAPNTTSLALSIIDNSNPSSLKEVFNVYGNGYTEINVSNPSGMPVPTGASWGRVFTIRDTHMPRDLFVVRSDGVVLTREVEIRNDATFPDYVFAKEYKLKSINEVEKYIIANKHLPGFEKAEHYEKNGINVSNIIIKQQEKLEEMMLYIIELEKRLTKVENK